MNSEPIFHLLKPKEFRTWCLPNRLPSPAMVTTRFVSKCNCTNCLTNYRRSLGKPSAFRKKWTDRAVWTEHTPPLEE